MNAKKAYFITIGILLMILAVIIWSYFNRDEEVINESKEIVPEEEISDEQMRNTVISLYFINKDTGEIQVETRLIDSKRLLENPYLELLNLWFGGPNKEELKTNYPGNIEVNNVTLEGECAVIDFSQKFIDEYNGNEEEKIKVIYCLVDTLTELNEINAIKIVVDGKENQYLGEFNLSEKYYRLNN